MTSARVLLVRRTLAVVLAFAWAFAAWVADLGLALTSEDLGWLYGAAVLAAGWVGAVLLWQPARRSLALAVAVAVALGVGLVAWYTGPPTHERIREAADEVAVPASWEETSDTDVGSTLCFKGCPEVERLYAVDAAYDDAVAEVAAAFEDAGWDVEETDEGLACSRGRWEARVSEQYPEGSPTEVEIVFAG